MADNPEWKDETFVGCEDNYNNPAKEPKHEWELIGYSKNKQIFECINCSISHNVYEDNPSTWLRNISGECNG